MVVSQGFLAGAVAKALGTFCELDESLVESRLLNKSRITLKDVRLRPKTLRQTNNYNVELHGRIKSGVFKWKWSGKGLLRKCTFTLSGLRITLKPQSSESGDIKKSEKKKKDMAVGSPVSVMSSEDSETKKGKKNWKKKLIDNVIEQLTVKIEDVQVVLEAPRNSKEEDMPWSRQIIIYGKDLELEPLGRLYHSKKFLQGRTFKKSKQNAPLLQDLRVGSLSAKVVVIRQNGAAEMLPLIHPFQYSAKAKRVHGRRFASLTNGLEVIGQKISSLEPPLIRPSFTQSGSLGGGGGAYESIRTGGDRVEIYADEQEVETSLCQFSSLNNSQSVSWEFSQCSSFQDARDEIEVGNSQDELEVADEVYIVLGDEQLTSLFSVMTLFTDKKDKGGNQKEPRPLSRTSYLKKTYYKPGGLDKITRVAPMTFAKSSRSIIKASHFDLPFPMVQIDLPNNNTLYAEECNIKFRADDSLAKIFGTGNVSINNETLLEGGGTWTVDIRRKEIRIEPPKESAPSQWEWNFNDGDGHDDDDDEAAGSQLTARFDRIRKLSGGIAQILQKKRSIQAKKTPSLVSIPDASESNKWSLKLVGNSCLQF